MSAIRRMPSSAGKISLGSAEEQPGCETQEGLEVGGPGPWTVPSGTPSTAVASGRIVTRVKAGQRRGPSGAP